MTRTWRSPVGRQNTASGTWPGLLGDPLVFVEEAAEDGSALEGVRPEGGHRPGSAPPGALRRVPHRRLRPRSALLGGALGRVRLAGPPGGWPGPLHGEPPPGVGVGLPRLGGGPRLRTPAGGEPGSPGAGAGGSPRPGSDAAPKSPEPRRLIPARSPPAGPAPGGTVETDIRPG